MCVLRCNFILSVNPRDISFSVRRHKASCRMAVCLRQVWSTIDAGARLLGYDASSGISTYQTFKPPISWVYVIFVSSFLFHLLRNDITFDVSPTAAALTRLWTQHTYRMITWLPLVWSVTGAGYTVVLVGLGDVFECAFSSCPFLESYVARVT